MNYLVLILISLLSLLSYSLPVRYTDLLDYVQEAPDQGDTATCLYMGTTGAAELLLNQKYNIRNPKKGDIFDISERYTLSQRASEPSNWQLKALNRLNKGWFIHDSELPFNAYNEDGTNNSTVWRRPADFNSLPRVEISERFKGKKIFTKGKNRYSKYVVNQNDILKVKQALVNTNAPVLINYNHDRWWHIVNIVGFDDEAMGECLHTPASECNSKGGFYVRDSLGKATHLRSYDWFRVNANAAFSITLDN